MTKKENVLEKCRINLDKEKVLHSITRGERDKYKERIDKAIDYIINHSDASGSFDGKVFYVERIENIKNGTKLLNILKGDEK